MAEQTQPIEQPATESIETPDFDARMEALFGGKGAAEPEQPEDGQAPVDEASTSEVPSEPEAVEVEFNGTKYTVPPELKDALMAQADYTAKTTEIANTRRAVELQQKEIALYNEQRQFEAQLAPDFDRLKMFDAYIQHTKATTDWSKLTTDQVVRAKMEIDTLTDQRNELANALKGKYDEFQAKQKGERDKLKQSASEILSKAVTGWSDETKASVEKYAISAGYPEIAIQSMSALDYQMAWKAQQYDKIKAETKSAVKKAADAPAIHATARKTPMPKQVRAKFDLQKAVKSGNQAAIKAALDKRTEQIFGG
jgi:hypothetical protein